MFCRPYDQIRDIIGNKSERPVSICGWVTHIETGIERVRYRVRDPSGLEITLSVAKPDATLKLGSVCAAVGRLKWTGDGPVVIACRVFNLDGNVNVMPATRDTPLETAVDRESNPTLTEKLRRYRFEPANTLMPMLRDCYTYRRDVMAVQVLFVGFRDLINLALDLLGEQERVVGSRDLLLTRHLPIEKAPPDARFCSCENRARGEVDAFECRHCVIGVIATGRMTETDGFICKCRTGTDLETSVYGMCPVPRGILEINLDNLNRYKGYKDTRI